MNEEIIYDLTTSGLSITEQSQYRHRGYIVGRKLEESNHSKWNSKKFHITSSISRFVEEFGWALKIRDIKINVLCDTFVYRVHTDEYEDFNCHVFLDSVLLDVSFMYYEELIKRLNYEGLEAYPNGEYLFAKRKNYNNYNTKKFEER